eukprot:3906110-Amphidinium_carterae.1
MDDKSKAWVENWTTECATLEHSGSTCFACKQATDCKVCMSFPMEHFTSTSVTPPAAAPVNDVPLYNQHAPRITLHIHPVGCWKPLLRSPLQGLKSEKRLQELLSETEPC